MVKVDGKEYAASVTNLERNFNITDGENAGRLLLILKMERDVQGTFYNYTMTIDSDFMNDEDYSELYLKLSAPVDSHVLEVPFNQEVLTFDAYVTSGKDKLKKVTNYNKENQKNHWGELTVNFIAIEPQRRPA